MNAKIIRLNRTLTHYECKKKGLNKTIPSLKKKESSMKGRKIKINVQIIIIIVGGMGFSVKWPGI
jgi:hypothetical protein